MLIQVKGLPELIAKMQARSERVQALEPALLYFGEDIVTRTDNHFRAQTNWNGSAFAPLADSTLEARVSSGVAGRTTGGNRATRAKLRTKLKAEGKTGREITKAMRRQTQTYQYKRITYAIGLSRNERIAAYSKAQDAFAKRNDKLRATAGSDRTGLAKALRKSRAQYNSTKKRIASPGSIQILIDTARARNSNHIDPPQPTSVLWSAVGYLGYHMTGTRRMPERNPTPFVYVSNAWQLAPDAQADLVKAVTNYVFRGLPEQGAA